MPLSYRPDRRSGFVLLGTVMTLALAWVEIIAMHDWPETLRVDRSAAVEHVAPIAVMRESSALGTEKTSPPSLTPVESTASLSMPASTLPPTDPEQKDRFAMRYVEAELWNNSVKEMRSRGFSLQGFFHVSTIHAHWPKVITEQLRILDGARYIDGDGDVQYLDSFSEKFTDVSVFASVLKEAQNLLVNVAILNNDLSQFSAVSDLIVNKSLLSASSRAKISMEFNLTIPRQSFNRKPDSEKDRLLNEAIYSEGEVSTMLKLQEYCQHEVAAGRPNALVFYLHSKSTCCWPRASHNPREMAGATWRDMMMAGNFEFPSICLRALLMGYPVCGAQIGDGKRLGWFSGNFFWAHCGHVAAWPPMLRKNRFNAWWPEFVVMEAGRSDFEDELWRRQTWAQQCAYEALSCAFPSGHARAGQRFDQSMQPCSRAWYLRQIEAHLATTLLLKHKPGSLMNQNPAICESLWRRGRYDMQPGYLNSSLYFF